MWVLGSQYSSHLPLLGKNYRVFFLARKGYLKRKLTRLKMQLGLNFFSQIQKQNQVKLTRQRSFLRLKGLFDEVDCQADKPHNGHSGRWPQSYPVVVAVSQYTKTFRGRKFFTISELIFLKFQPETEHQQRVGVICQNSVALVGALEDY